MWRIAQAVLGVLLCGGAVALWLSGRGATPVHRGALASAPLTSKQTTAPVAEDRASRVAVPSRRSRQDDHARTPRERSVLRAPPAGAAAPPRHDEASRSEKVDPGLVQELWLAEIAAARAASRLGLDDPPAPRAEGTRRASADAAQEAPEAARRASQSDLLIVEMLVRQQQLPETYADGSPALAGNELVKADLARWVADLDPEARLKMLEQALTALE